MLYFNLATQSSEIKRIFHYANPLPKSNAVYSESESVDVTITTKPIKVDLDILGLGQSLLKERNLNIYGDGVYITKYMEGKVLIYTDVKKRKTVGYICEDVENTYKTMRYAGWIRSHIIYHLVANNYFVLHAAGIVDEDCNLYIIIGESQSGKSTFVLDALTRGNYKIISDDRLLISPDMNMVLGNSRYVRCCMSDVSNYSKAADSITAINSGIYGKMAFGISDNRRLDSISLNPSKKVHIVFLDARMACKDSIKNLDIIQFGSLINATQKEQYPYTFSKQMDRLVDILSQYNMVQIKRNEEGRNYSIFQQYYCHNGNEKGESGERAE